MLNNFIYAQTKELFLEALGAGNILDEAIVFIEDTKEIWNHGHYFAGDCGFDPQMISDLQTLIANHELAANKSLSDLDDRIDELSDTIDTLPFAVGEGADSAVLANSGCTATGAYSVALGYYSNATGYGAYAEGGYSTASGNYSHVEGYGNIANGVDQNGNTFEGVHVEGKLNSPVPGVIHSVGIGTADDNRFNAHDIMLDGRHYIYGVGGYDGKNPDEAFDLASCLQRVCDSSSTYNLVGTDLSNNETGIIYSDIIMQNNSISAPNGFFETSDARLKNFSTPIDVDLDKLYKLTKSYFTWKDSDNTERQLGVSAQEIRELYPEIVNENVNGTLSVAYDKLSVVALAAIDELNDENKELKNKVNNLEKRLSKLESLLNKN